LILGGIAAHKKTVLATEVLRVKKDVRMPAVQPALDALTDLVLDSQPRSTARN